MEPINIRFGGYQPPTSVHNKAAEMFGNALATRLGEAVTFSLDGNIIASGRQAVDLLRLVERGELTLCYFSASYLAERVPAFALLDLPFLLTNRPTAYAVLDGPLGQHLAEQLAAHTGFRLLDWWDNGFRHLSNRVRPIQRPADCQGLRLRTLMSDLHQEVFRLLGFEPVALDVKDLLAGVKAGTIDAQENPLTNIYNFGIHEHHRYITLSSHFFGAAVLLCHQATTMPGRLTSNTPSTLLQLRRLRPNGSSPLRKMRRSWRGSIQAKMRSSNSLRSHGPNSRNFWLRWWMPNGRDWVTISSAICKLVPIRCNRPSSQANDDDDPIQFILSCGIGGAQLNSVCGPQPPDESDGVAPA